jgi:hypothetical protein
MAIRFKEFIFKHTLNRNYSPISRRYQQIIILRNQPFGNSKNRTTKKYASKLTASKVNFNPINMLLQKHHTLTMRISNPIPIIIGYDLK